MSPRCPRRCLRSAYVRSADRPISARISGATAHHCPLSGWLPYGETVAVADVADAASGRADLLAQHAGLCLGLVEAEQIDAYAAHRLAMASLCALAGGG